MRKYKLEKTVNGKAYTNELRQFIANQVDIELNRSNKSIKTIWESLGSEFNLGWSTVRRYHNALGNSPSARKRNSNQDRANVFPISIGKYSEELRSEVMRYAMRFGVPQTSNKFKICEGSVYDWLKAYGLSTAYFNR
jgi:transposase